MFEPTVWPEPGVNCKLLLPVASPDISETDIQGVLATLRETQLSGTSPVVQECEAALEVELGGTTLLVSNGSVALILALRALGIGRGDEVLLPTLTYAATASSVIHVGASPVFCDSSAVDWNISLDDIRKQVTRKTKAIILVDLYGVTRNWGDVVAFARERGLFIIHDCAESLGAKWNGLPSGVLADVQTYSFFANKIITSGEGGAVVTRDSELLRRMRILRGQGMSETYRYWFEMAGYNFRLSGLQASLLLPQVKRLSAVMSKRRKLFEFYDDLFDGFADRPKPPEAENVAPWLYTATLRKISPKNLAALLSDVGVQTRPAFYPLHRMPAFRSPKRAAARFPVADRLSDSSISFPTWTEWSPEKLTGLSRVVQQLKSG